MSFWSWWHCNGIKFCERMQHLRMTASVIWQLISKEVTMEMTDRHITMICKRVRFLISKDDDGDQWQSKAYGVEQTRPQHPTLDIRRINVYVDDEDMRNANTGRTNVFESAQSLLLRTQCTSNITRPACTDSFAWTVNTMNIINLLFNFNFPLWT